MTQKKSPKFVQINLQMYNNFMPNEDTANISTSGKNGR